MKLMKTEDAIGQMLCHDITQIIPGVKKGPVFKKGHIIEEQDVAVLKSVGKNSVYIWEVDDTMMHENDAAEVLCSLSINENMERGGISEGKIELTAACDGLFKVDRKRLKTVNSFGQMMIACRHGNFPVKKGDKLAGMRIIPLIIEKDKMEAVKEKVGDTPIFSLLPFQHKKVGILTTGNEVYSGLIEDGFTPVLEKKLAEYDTEIIAHRISSDDPEMEKGYINELYDLGADLILCTGGMSVDPDDRTPAAIRDCSDRVISYGSPVLPGAMFMLAYRGNVPICGLPGCVMFAGRTVFDLVLPRLMADDPVEKDDLDSLGEGGLCLGCKPCTFPNCGFGKGH